MIILLVALFLAGVFLAIVIATMGALGIVLLVLLVCFGFALPEGPKDKLKVWWAVQTTVDPKDKKGRTPLQRDAENFMAAFNGK